MKKSRAMEKRVENISSIQKIAHEHLSAIYREHHENNRKFVLNQLLESQKHLSKSNLVLSEGVAEFRKKFAVHLNAAAVSDPKFISKQIDRHFGDWSDERKDDGFLWGRYMHEIFEAFREVDPRIHGIDEPVILDYQAEMNVREIYVILGNWFGDTPGQVYFDSFVGSPDLKINATIRSWGEGFVDFVVPEDSEMIPFHANGRLNLKRADGKTTSVDVILEPIAHLYFYRKEYSDSGFKIEPDLSPLSYRYKKEKLFKSPPLPDEVLLFEAPDLTDAPGVILGVSNNKVMPGYPGVTATLDSTYQADNRLNVNVVIKGGWYWDYTVTVDFYIVVPQGFTVDGGWTDVRDI